MEHDVHDRPAGGSRRWTASEKVTLLLLALGGPQSLKLIQQLEPAEIKKVMAAASSVSDAVPADIEALVQEFAEQFAETLPFAGDERYMRNLLEGAIPGEQLESMLSSSGAEQHKPVWGEFTAGMENTLTPYLLDEHPQTSAYIISNLESGFAAHILAMLPREIRVSVTRRMLKMQSATPRASQIVQSCLRSDLLAKADNRLEKAGRQLVASFMNKMDRAQAGEILETLAQERPDDAKALKKMLFQFEDMAKLDHKARLIIFDKVAVEQVIVALRGTQLLFRELVLSALGARARRMVEAELKDDKGEITKDVLAARRAIADYILGLVAAGDVVFQNDEEPPKPAA